MNDEREARLDARLDSIEPGWDVYGSDDQKIGSVDAVEPESIAVEKGLLFVHEMQVPQSAIADVDPDEHRVTLNVTKDAVGDMGWTPPAADASSGHAAGDRETWGQGTIETHADPDPLLTREPVLPEDDTADVRPGRTSEQLWDR